MEKPLCVTILTGPAIKIIHADNGSKAEAIYRKPHADSGNDAYQVINADIKKLQDFYVGWHHLRNRNAF